MADQDLESEEDGQLWPMGERTLPSRLRIQPEGGAGLVWMGAVAWQLARPKKTVGDRRVQDRAIP